MEDVEMWVNMLEVGNFYRMFYKGRMRLRGLTRKHREEFDCGGSSGIMKYSEHPSCGGRKNEEGRNFCLRGFPKGG